MLVQDDWAASRKPRDLTATVNDLVRSPDRSAVKVHDFIILVKSQRAGERVLRSITQYLQRRLKLVINEKKSHVLHSNQSTFIGFTFNGGQIKRHPKTLEAFKQKST